MTSCDETRVGHSLTRRRFLTISAAALLSGPAQASAPVARWTGYALGAPASMALAGVEEKRARVIFAAVEAELDRLERIFSLYRADSTLSRLNQSGRLDTPPPDFVQLIQHADGLHRSTGGAFDPTVQPLWRLAARAASQGRRPSEAELAETRRRTGWRHLQFDRGSIHFDRAGMALTFNGIAQGYIADRVADLLRSRGLQNVLIDMGEVVAVGRRPDGAHWRAGIATPDGTMVGQVTLSDRALATSAPLGTLMDHAGRIGHILDPRTGRSGGRWRLVSVTAPNATLADGLSTAFCLMPQTKIRAVLAEHPGTEVAASI